MINSYWPFYADVLGDDVKRYIAESRRSSSDLFDNYIYDYIYAENENEAIETYKTLLLELGCVAEELEEMEFRVKECE